MPEIPPKSSPAVVDLKVLGNVPDETALNASGVLDDTQMTLVGVAKRINRALYADYSDMPSETQQKITALRQDFLRNINNASYEQVVAEGKMYNLLIGYLELMVEGYQNKADSLIKSSPGISREDAFDFLQQRIDAQEKAKKYAGDLNFHRTDGGQLIRDMALKAGFKESIEAGGFLPEGKLAAMLAAPTPDQQPLVSDLTNDVLGIQEAHRLTTEANLFPRAALERYAADPQGNAALIDAIAATLARGTRSLNSFPFAQESPEHDRIRALEELVSAQVHYAMKQPRAPGERLAAEQRALAHVQETMQVVWSLADDYLKVGPAKDDPRTRQIAANFEKEAAEKNIVLLPLNDATAKAALLARTSAQDLLQVVQNDGVFRAKVDVLAKAAGANIDTQPLQPAAYLISASPQAQDMAAGQCSPLTLSTEALAKFVDKLLGKRSAGTPSGGRNAA